MKPVRKNIVSDSGAFIRALSRIFSRQEFLDMGFPVSHGLAGWPERQRLAHGGIHVLNIPSPVARKNATGGFSVSFRSQKP